MIFKKTENLSEKDILSKNNKISWRWEDNSNATICISTFSKYLLLNESSALLFCLCNGKNSVEEIYKNFSSCYSNSKKEDITKTLGRFLRLGITTRNRGLDVKPIWQKKLSTEKKEFVNFEIDNYPRIKERYMKKGKIVRFKYPLLADFELLYDCNLNCDKCYNEKQGKGIVCQNKVYKIIDKIVEARCLHITLLGGEPLMHKNILKIIKYCKNKGLIVKLISNGTLLNRSVIRKLEECGLDVIVISIDSLKKDANTPVRHSKNLDIILKNIGILSKTRIKVAMGCVLNKSNIMDIWRFYSFGVKNKLSTVRFLVLIMFPNKEKEFNELKDFHVSYFDLLKIISSIKALKIFNKILNEPIELHFTAYPYGYCVAKSTLFTISPKGEMRMCPHCGHVIGSINKSDVLDIWRSKEFSDIVDYDNYQFPCNICYKRKKCAGFCRAEANAYTGDIFGHLPDCIVGRVYTLLRRYNLVKDKKRVYPTTHKNVVWI